MRAGYMLLACALLAGAAFAQLPPLPSACEGRIADITVLMGSEDELAVACPKGAPTCSDKCRLTLEKVSGQIAPWQLHRHN